MSVSVGGICGHIKITKYFRVFGMASILGFITILTFVIYPISTTDITQDAEATTRSANASTLNFVGSNLATTVNLSVSSSSGTFATSTENQKTRFSISTNNYTGYTLAIETAANSSALSAILQPSSSIDSIQSVTTSSDFSNPADPQSVNDKWGYLPNYYHSVANADYIPAPSIVDTTNHTTDILDATATANSTPKEYTIGLGVRATYNSPAGVYRNATFVLKYLANPILYSITFNNDSGDNTVGNMPSDIEDELTTSTTVTLPNNLATPTRTGYVFNAWCLGPTSSSGTVCTSGTTVSPGDTIGIDQVTGNNTIALYALWDSSSNVSVTVNFGGAGVSSVILADGVGADIVVTTSGSVVTLTYNTTYSITMTLSSGYEFVSWATTVGGTLGSSSANPTTYQVSSTAALTATGRLITMQTWTGCSSLTAGDTITLPDARDGNQYQIGKIGNYCYMLENLKLSNTDNNQPRVLTSDDSDINPSGVTYTDPQTNQSTTVTTFTMPTESWGSGNSQNYYCKAIMATATSANFGTQYYYNWYAAKANPYQCSNPTSNTNATTQNDNYSLGSICPKGWTLPTYDDDITATMLNNNNSGGMTATGYFRSGQASTVGSRGYWWSRTRFTNNSKAYYIYFNGRTTSLATTFDKTYGLSVRCMYNRT